ncbi:MAG TPA: hypothetical protein VG895_00530 [Patescibacteria group bacterium]|nr:hypothetical protein [Gammaproteobacteria bacterium]HWA51528.1 hypothetical protein [Patescibacteria group bacterium]
MVIKRRTTAKSKSADFSKQVRQLETCLKQDQLRLEKIYPKVLTDIDKSIKQTTMQLKKLKAKSKPAKTAKKSISSTKVKPVNTTALEKQLEILKAEKLVLQVGHKKLLAQKKAQQKFEKIWAKKSVKPKKTRKKSHLKKLTAKSISHPDDLPDLR